MNNSEKEEVNLFQIWIFPNEQEVTPRYDQKKFNSLERTNNLQVLVSSIDEENGESLKIHQDAQISRIDLDGGSNFSYTLKSENHGVYVMVINGEINIAHENLSKRDAIGISQTKTINMNVKNTAELLLIEVPMQF